MPQEISQQTDSKPLTASDILSALNETSDASSNEGTEKTTKEPEVTIPDDTSARSDDNEETPEDHEEIIIPDESTDDTLTYEPSVNVSQLKKDFPELAKKYPTLEKTLRREAHYTEVFPTIQEARDAAEQVQNYRNIESELSSGSISGVLSELQRNNKESFTKITDDLLSTVRQLDEQSFLKISGNNLKQALYGVFQRGKNMKNDDGEQLALAAQILHKEIFNSSDVSASNGNSNSADPKLTDERKKLESERAEFEQNTFNSHVNDVNGRVKSNIKEAISSAIDTKNVMTPYVKSKAIDDCMNALIQSIQDDKRFNQQLTNGWMTVRNEKYSDSAKSKIRTMLITKAKAELPAIVQRIKNEALKGASARTKEASESKDEKPLPRGRGTSGEKSSSSKSKDIPRNMSTRDYLMQD